VWRGCLLRRTLVNFSNFWSLTRRAMTRGGGLPPLGDEAKSTRQSGRVSSPPTFVGGGRRASSRGGRGTLAFWIPVVTSAASECAATDNCRTMVLHPNPPPTWEEGTGVDPRQAKARSNYRCNLARVGDLREPPMNQSSSSSLASSIGRSPVSTVTSSSLSHPFPVLVKQSFKPSSTQPNLV